VASRKRPQREPTDNWPQLRLALAWPEQHAYELIRPVVLFGRSPAERAQQTGVSERTIYRKRAHFDALGIVGLLEAEPQDDRRQLPPAIRQAIRELKAEYPSFRPNELASICYARFSRRPSSHTIKRLLAEEPPLPVTRRRYPPYREIHDPAERRLAIVRLHSEGWRVTSIAGYLETNRPRVYATLRRWVAEGVYGLDDKSHARKPGVRKVDLRTIALVRELQENPELGEFRIHTALKVVGIELSPRTCGRILALNRALYGLPTPVRGERTPKAMPFKAVRRHQYWTIDIRYLDHTLDEDKIYCISILENFSRAIVASAISRRQDLTAVLLVLYTAVRQHGAPEMLVSDSGRVFRAKEAQRIYAALGIDKREIDRRQAWQSYIETAFNVQRRMADWHFARATSWSDLLTVHDQWVAEYNYQSHWAHRERQDGRLSPAAVLDRVCGRLFTPDDLGRIFRGTRFGRLLNRLGYVRFRHWRVYGERGLAGKQAAVWLHGETLTVAFADEPLARYQVSYQPDGRQLATVTEAEQVETLYHAPQPPLWDWGPGEWLSVLRAAPYAPRQPRPADPGWQRPLPLSDQLAVAHDERRPIRAADGRS
jgi:putative transposase